jgi:hypothetical protein
VGDGMSAQKRINVLSERWLPNGKWIALLVFCIAGTWLVATFIYGIKTDIANNTHRDEIIITNQEHMKEELKKVVEWIDVQKKKKVSKHFFASEDLEIRLDG